MYIIRTPTKSFCGHKSSDIFNESPCVYVQHGFFYFTNVTTVEMQISHVAREKQILIKNKIIHVHTSLCQQRSVHKNKTFSPIAIVEIKKKYIYHQTSRRFCIFYLNFYVTLTALSVNI